VTTENKGPVSFRTSLRRYGWLTASIISMVLVLAILYFGWKSMCCGGNATKAKANIGTLQALLMQYSLKFSSYPSEEQGLRALLVGGITDDEQLLTDPWGEPVRYRVPGVRSGDKFDVYSTGRDEMDGTNDDIGNWEEVASITYPEKIN
jgi:type II secretion system protein G